MIIDIANYRPKPTEWLKTRIEYIGEGRAVFEEPAGIIKGTAKAVFNENGDYSITMEAESVESPNALSSEIDTIYHILSGQEPVKIEEGYIWGGPFPQKRNKCTQFSITTLQGIFSVTGKIRYQHSAYKLEFFVIQSEFKVASSKKEHYWAIPLSNFTSDFVQSHELLNQHPLRIYPTPKAPERVTIQKEILANLYANSRNKLIILEYFGKLAFIESLPDYKERIEKLKNGHEQILITSVMVGEVAPFEFDKNEQLQSLNFIPLLRLASGKPVGAPWIELRDREGNLVRRIHKQIYYEPYKEGRIPLREGVGNPKIGNFLTSAQASPHFNKDYVLIPASLVIEGGFHDFNIADALANLFRAFEILCKEYNIQSEDLLGNLDPVYQEQIKRILEDANAEIIKFSKSISGAERYQQKRNMERIAARVISAKDRDNDSGLAICKLLDKFGFHDANILDNHYAMNPRPDGRTWQRLLSYCRGVGMHDIRIDTEYVRDFYTVKNHLYDILIRIIFHLLDYQGTYTSIFAKHTSSEVSVNWIDASLPANNLGYE